MAGSYLNHETRSDCVPRRVSLTFPRRGGDGVTECLGAAAQAALAVAAVPCIASAFTNSFYFVFLVSPHTTARPRCAGVVIVKFRFALWSVAGAALRCRLIPATRATPRRDCRDCHCAARPDYEIARICEPGRVGPSRSRRLAMAHLLHFHFLPPFPCSFFIILFFHFYRAPRRAPPLTRVTSALYPVPSGAV